LFDLNMIVNQLNNIKVFNTCVSHVHFTSDLENNIKVFNTCVSHVHFTSDLENILLLL
jgi:ribosome-binding factor A